MLGVFLLPAFTRLGHECRSGNACVHEPWSILSSKRVLGNGVRTHVNSKCKIPSTGGSEQDRTCNAASHRTVSPTHYQLSFSCPKTHDQTKISPGTPSKVSHTHDLIFYTLVATPPGAWHHRISAIQGESYP